MLRLRIYIWVCFALIMNSLWAQTPAVLIKGKADSRECEEWVEARLKEMTLKEKIALKDYSNAIALDTALNDIDVLTISPVGYVILDVHNEKSKQDKDYVKYVLIDAGGNKYVTGSESFFTSFKDIFDVMADEAPNEEYSIVKSNTTYGLSVYDHIVLEAESIQDNDFIH